ncbi:hypothetical protein D3C81_1496610 [compost metagenome]
MMCSLQVLFTNDRSEEYSVIQSIADLHADRAFSEPLDEFISNTLFNSYNGTGHTSFSGGAEGCGDHIGKGLVKISVIQHNGVVFSSG